MSWGSCRLVPEPVYPSDNGYINNPSLKTLKSRALFPQEMRSVLRKAGSPGKARRARLNPLVLLLDAALTGELDVVQQAVKEVSAAGERDGGVGAVNAGGQPVLSLLVPRLPR